jgi:hypothetical protein
MPRNYPATVRRFAYHYHRSPNVVLIAALTFAFAAMLLNFG